MKSRYIILSLLLVLSIGFISYQVTHALFSDSAQSTDNTFSAAPIFPTSAPTETPTPTPTPTPPTISAGDVVINELMWMGGFNSGDEWVELRNRSSSPINVKGWNLTRWDQGDNQEETLLQIPSNQDYIVPAGGYFLIARRTAQAATSNLNIDPDVVNSSAPFILNNENLQIKLYDGAWETGATLIDTAGDKDDPLAGVNGTGADPDKSMERNDTPGDGTQASSWHTATSSINFDVGDNDLGTPRAANSL